RRRRRALRRGDRVRDRRGPELAGTRERARVRVLLRHRGAPRAAPTELDRGPRADAARAARPAERADPVHEPPPLPGAVAAGAALLLRRGRTRGVHADPARVAAPT